MRLRIHYLQHVPFEGLGSIGPTLRERGHELTGTRLFEEQQLPSVDHIDWLIVMGGPMGANDDDRFPWLASEKSLIYDAIDSGKVVLGICLGAQLIASVLGAKVYKNQYREIGWFPIERAPESMATILGDALPIKIEAFHWHSDTFDLPKKAILLASSEACRNQGFVLENRVVGLQFHLETTPDSARELIKNCRGELNLSKYVQSETDLFTTESRFSNINKVMSSVLSRLEE